MSSCSYMGIQNYLNHFIPLISFIPHESRGKPLVFCFQDVQKFTSGMKSVKMNKKGNQKLSKGVPLGKQLFKVKVNDNPLNTGRKLNARKTFKRHPGRLLSVLCTFKLGPVSRRRRCSNGIIFDFGQIFDQGVGSPIIYF